MKQKLFTLFLAFLASIGTISASNIQVDGIWYDFNSNTQTATVTYQGTYSDSYENEYTDSVVIPSSVTYNGITYSVRSIGSEAFYNCTGLTSVTIPNSVTSIGNYAFQGCTGLTSITLNSNAIASKNYSSSTISNIFGSQVRKYIIGDDVTSIGISAFQGCTGLTSVTIPNSVTTIGKYAFQGCTGLTEVHINDLSAWCKISFPIYYSNPLYYAKHLYLNETEITNLVIPSEVMEIKSYAFSRCTGLTSVTIPNSVTSIGNSAFENCTGLTSITIPNSVTSIGNSAFENCTGLTSITIPNSVTSIGDYTFYNCTGLTSVTIGNSVTSIGKSDFSGCTGLTSITLNSNAIVSKNYSSSSTISNIFGSQVRKYIIGDDVTSIGNYAFYNCTNIDSVAIGKNVTSIGLSSFQECNGLKSVIIPEGLQTTGKYPFRQCENLNTVVWNAVNCTTYDDGEYVYPPFQGCANVTSFTIGDQVETLPRGLCFGLPITSIEIPSGVTSIGTSAFRECSGLTSVTIPNSVTSIGNSAFRECSGLTYVAIPNSVTSIGGYAFYTCTGLTSLSLGENVSTYGSYVFYGCSALTSIYNYRERPAKLGTDAFSGVDYFNCTLYVLASSIDMYKSSGSDWKDFYFIEPIGGTSTTVTDNKVTVTPSDDTALFTWPTDDNAASYSLEITKDSVVFCILTFNSNGQLTNIAFAPSRNGQPHAPAATMTASGMQFTVTGLSGACKYAYRLAVTDDANNELIAYSGEFATTGYEGDVNPGGEPEKQVFTIRFVNWDGAELLSLDVREGEMPVYSGENPIRQEDEQYTYTFIGWTPEISVVSEDATYTATYQATEKLQGIEDVETFSTPQKIVKDGQILILRGERVYTVTGQEVR